MIFKTHYATTVTSKSLGIVTFIIALQSPMWWSLWLIKMKSSVNQQCASGIHGFLNIKSALDYV
jgi:hypothetical protein